MRYVIRAIKYFFYFVFLLAVMMGILVAVGAVGADPASMFRNGYDSLWQIAAMFAVLAAFYPYFGFMKKDALLKGSYEELRPKVLAFMEERRYRLEDEDGQRLTFRYRPLAGRLTRMLEDRITFTRQMDGFQVEGLRRDVVRLVYGLEARLREDA